jgi:hypothetical protein
MLPIAFDMETNDPDDALTLCLLATHPRAETVNPGTRAQLGVVRRLLGELDVEVPIGVRDSSVEDERVGRLVFRGGFAGDNLVAPERRLAKFDGRVLSESHDLGGNKEASLAVLGDARIARKELVCKNVTHGVLWDAEFHAALPGELPPGVALMRDAMAIYLEHAPEGKALQDPLALYEAGRWGAEAAEKTDTFISIGVDRERFLATLMA